MNAISFKFSPIKRSAWDCHKFMLKENCKRVFWCFRYKPFDKKYVHIRWMVLGLKRNWRHYVCSSSEPYKHIFPTINSKLEWNRRMQHIFYELKIVDMLVACTNKLIKTKGRREGRGVTGRRGDRESTQENLIWIGKGIGHRAWWQPFVAHIMHWLWTVNTERNQK